LSSFHLILSIVCRLFFWPFLLCVILSFDPFHCLLSFLLTLSMVCPLLQTIERVKRKVDKQPKGSKEKRTNNRKGQKKRGQTMERVKIFCWPFRLFVHFSFDPFDYLSSLLLTLSMVCPLFFWPFRLLGSKEKRTNNWKGQQKRG
jgi:hypothetical protein